MFAVDSIIIALQLAIIRLPILLPGYFSHNHSLLFQLLRVLFSW
jgi:hypothetical protein